MPRSNVGATASGMLSDLKSRLGFSRDSDESYRHDDYDYDEYDDFDDDGFSPQNDREYAGYGYDYDENSTVGFRPATAHSSRFGRADSTPDLVSIEDVKANAPVSGGSSRSRARSGRNLVENSGPAESSPAYRAAVRERDDDSSHSRSEGLNSLFEPSTGSSRVTTRLGSSYDSRDLPSSSASTYAATRGVTVLKPMAYDDAARVTSALKAGDVVVLDMHNTPADLLNRILDFSFGVASALDANVECPVAKVFAIARGRALTENEKQDLRAKGVL